MHSYIKQGAAVSAAVMLSVAGVAATLDPQDFSVGWPLEMSSDAKFFDIPLTFEIYQHAHDLDQVAVLDAQGEPMPFYRVARSMASATERVITLSPSPVYEVNEGGSVSELTVETEGASIRTTLSGERAGEAAEITGFILDARDVEDTPVAIEFDWAAQDQPFLTEIRIEQSQDLNQWRQVGRGSIAGLDIDGTRVRQGRIPVEASRGGYYRVTWERNVNDWNLQQSTLIIFDTPEPAPFGTATLAPVEGPPAEEEENVLYFDAGGLVPTTRFQLEFSKSNRWVNASVFRSDSIDGPWQWLSGHLFYQVEYEGVQFNNSAVDVRGPRRYWKFELDGPVDQQDVGLRLDYLEDSIRVAANGTAPYMLVGGTLLEEAGPDTTFANVWQRLDATELVLETAGVGQRRQLGGAAALLPPTTIPWQTVVLWGSLFAGVLLVAWMAVRLGREAFSGSSSDQ